MRRDSTGRFVPQQRAPRQTGPLPAQPWAMTRSECERTSFGRASAIFGLLGGVAAGAAAMYLLDPEHGRERRSAALVATNRALETATDAVSGAYETTTDALGNVWHRATNQASGLSSAAAASIPSARSARKIGRRWFRRASNYGSDTLDSARSYLPTFGSKQGFSGTTTGITAAGALALGLGAMWLLDPERGRGRRAWIAQKATRVFNETGDFMRATGRHLRNKSVGYAHEARSMLPGERGQVDSDETISNRVRSELGRLGIAGSIGVRSEAGRITLSGRCATDDVDRILVVVRGVHGVSGIDNQLGVGERYPNQATSNMSA